MRCARTTGPGAGYDDEADRADVGAGRRIECPLHALWAGRDELGRWFDVLEVWRRWCGAPVSGRPLDCGHFLAEEAPEETSAELDRFLSAGGRS